MKIVFKKSYVNQIAMKTLDICAFFEYLNWQIQQELKTIMKTGKPQLSDLAQQALAAYNIIDYIRSFNPNQNRLVNPYTLTFKQELIDNHVVDLKVVTRNNFNKVMKIFTLKHNLDPSTPFLDFAGNHHPNMDNIQVHEYYPTETTKTLFNIMLNKKRKSVILGNFGLTKNIVVYLLWHLSTIIIDFRIIEDAKVLQPFVNLDKFLSIPKILYYELRDQDEQNVIQRLQNQYLDVDFNWKKQNLIKFCSKLQKQNEQKGIRIIYILLSAENPPDMLLAQMKKMKINGQHQSRIISNAFKILSNDKQKSVRPEFLIKEQFGKVCLTYEIDEFHTETRLGAGWRKMTYSVQKFASIKQFCTSSNSVINFQRAYFLLRQLQAYAQNMRKNRDRRKWMIKNIRKIYKELCVLMHDDESLYQCYEGEIELIDKLAQEQAETFTLLQSQFIQRSLNYTVNRNQSVIELQSKSSSAMFFFQTQHVTNDLSFRLEAMKKYLSLVINTKEEFVRQFRIMVYHLMSCYTQKFTLVLNGEPLNIKAQHRSTFLAIGNDKKIVDLDTHLGRLLPKVSRYGRPPYYLSACSGQSSESSCFDNVLLKWDCQQKQYDLKIIEWAFSDKIEDYWKQSSSKQLEQPMKPQNTIINEGNSNIPLVHRVVDIQRRVQTDLSIRIEHFVICPQKIMNALKVNKQIKKYLTNGSRRWRITLAAIEDVRFTGFTFQEDNLTSIINQLFENITLAKGSLENKNK